MKTQFLTLCLFFLLINFSIQWWQEGHMIVATIAKEELLKKQVEIANNQTNFTFGQTFDQIQEIVNALNNLSNFEDEGFVGVAPWADDVKSTGFLFNFQWHFINLEYNPSNFSTNYIPAQNNITFALDQVNMVIDRWNSGDGYKQKNINEKPSTPQQKNMNNISMEVAFMARYLIHLIGDLHQPLHCTTFVSKQFPDGDLGGNLIKIMFEGQPDVLHFFWDNLAHMLPSVERPLTSEGYSTLQQQAANITSSFPREFFQERLQQSNWTEWAQESYQLAVEYAYNDVIPKNVSESVQFPVTLTTQYQMRAWEVIQQQLAIAGYRLADLVVQYFSQYSQIQYYKDSNDYNKTSNMSVVQKKLQQFL